MLYKTTSRLKRDISNVLAILSGRKLPEHIVNELHINGEYEGWFYRYESWGRTIVRKGIIMDLEGKLPSTFYDSQGNLTQRSYKS